MVDLRDIKLTPSSSLDKAMLALCRSVDAKRARVVIDHILEHGIITNDELSDYGYDHPPRAIRDVRENGIPLITHNILSDRTGRRVAAYTFDDPSKVQAGRIGGRRAFPKRLKADLVARYGARDAITGAVLEERYLQIDHRVPYEVAGDGKQSFDLNDFMLLDASSNRAKSWSCEHCNNFLTKRMAAICKTCFWASPESYKHIAENPSRRVELVWTGQEVEEYESLAGQARANSIEISAYIKSLLVK